MPQCPNARDAHRPMCTLYILARNEADTLGRTVRSADPLAPEVVVGVDTSSSDRTREIATRIADVVVDIDFQGKCGASFAAARNQLGQAGHGEFGLSLDGHEFLARDSATLLKGALCRQRQREDRPDRWGAALRLHMSEDEGGVQAMALRCWRRHPEVRWERPVHEFLAGLERVDGMPKVIIRHERSVGRIEQRRAQRQNMDRSHLARLLDDDPTDAVAMWHLAGLLQEVGDHGRAAELATQCFHSSEGKKDSFRCAVAVFLSKLAVHRHDSDDGRQWAYTALQCHWNVPQAYTLLGESAELDGDLDQALFYYHTARTVPSVPLELPAPVRHHTWYPEYRAGRALLAIGDTDGARRCFNRALLYPLPSQVASELAPWRAANLIELNQDHDHHGVNDDNDSNQR